jgi:hypothetical protein
MAKFAEFTFHEVREQGQMNRLAALTSLGYVGYDSTSALYADLYRSRRELLRLVDDRPTADVHGCCGHGAGMI